MFRFLDTQAQLSRERSARVALENRHNNTELATTVTFVALAESGTIDPVTATEHSDLFSPWVAGIAYNVGAIRLYEGKLYKCVQSHTSQTDWTPTTTAALWTLIGEPGEEWPEWAQPVGAHDAYDMGAKVTYDGIRYTSTTAANVWQPGVYGWQAKE